MDVYQIVERFGGQSRLAKMLGKNQSTVQYWCKSGSIPGKWQTTLLSLAQAHGINLSPGDFVAVPETTALPNSTPIAEWKGTQDGNTFGDGQTVHTDITLESTRRARPKIGF